MLPCRLCLPGPWLATGGITSPMWDIVRVFVVAMFDLSAPCGATGETNRWVCTGSMCPTLGFELTKPALSDAGETNLIFLFGG